MKIEVKKSELISKPLWFHTKYLSQNKLGYGRKLKTEYVIRYNSRLHRVYNCLYSNSGILYIIAKGTDIIIEII